MPQNEPSILRVEGKDDTHAIIHLLLRHGVDCESIPVRIKSVRGDGDEPSGADRLLAEMETDVLASTDRSIGSYWMPTRSREISDRCKAVLHAWLAWQECPGLPYGTAIRAKYFGHDSAAALAFVAWFRRVFYRE